MPDRTRARQLAAEYLAKGNPTGWFEALYREAEHGKSTVPWDDRRPDPNLIDFWQRSSLPAAGRRALEIGCGYGDNGVQLQAWGFHTTAFDVSSAAIEACRRRFPSSAVRYVTADLLNPPEEWSRAFDFVLECFTLQVLPGSLRAQAIARAAEFVAPGGRLLVIARAREEQDPEGLMPWPLMRRELSLFRESGLDELSFEDYFDQESPPVRRFRALYGRQPADMPDSRL